MSVADRFARPQSNITQLSQGAMQQVAQAGQQLAALGVKHTTVAGQGVQSQATPAQRFARPAQSTPARGLSKSL